MPAGVSAPAPTLVFAHGYGCDQGMWQDVAQALSETNRILFDWPGAGQADPAAYDARRHATLEGYADDLLALMDELDRDADAAMYEAKHRGRGSWVLFEPEMHARVAQALAGGKRPAPGAEGRPSARGLPAHRRDRQRPRRRPGSAGTLAPPAAR